MEEIRYSLPQDPVPDVAAAHGFSADPADVRPERFFTRWPDSLIPLLAEGDLITVTVNGESALCRVTAVEPHEGGGETYTLAKVPGG